MVEFIQPCAVQSQRQVQRRFEAYLAGKPPPGQRVGSESSMAASSPDCAARQDQPGKRAGKSGKRAQPGSAGPSDAHRSGAESLAPAIREVVASCIASKLLPEAEYPPPLLQAPSQKQAKVLPAAARCVLTQPSLLSL